MLNKLSNWKIIRNNYIIKKNNYKIKMNNYKVINKKVMNTKKS